MDAVARPHDRLSLLVRAPFLDAIEPAAFVVEDRKLRPETGVLRADEFDDFLPRERRYDDAFQRRLEPVLQPLFFLFAVRRIGIFRDPSRDLFTYRSLRQQW